MYSHAAAAATPLLYLSDTILLLNALATQTFRARLVALVACETARGKLEAGEGVMSWSRGFAAAGVPSVLANLWSVDERATVTIYAAFYRFLYEGYPKDVALQRAKLEYLKNHAAATPFYWAAAALIGNSDAVVVPRTPALYYWVYIALGLAVFVAAGAGFFIRRRRVGMKRVGISSERLTFTLSLATFV